MDRKFYTNNRNNLLQKLPQGSMALIPSGAVLNYSLDGSYPFEINRDFYYFTGIEYQNMTLVFMKYTDTERVVLSIPRVDPTQEKWTGKMFTKKECAYISGIDEIVYNDELDDMIYSLMANFRINTAYMLLENTRKGMPDTLNNYIAHDYKRRYPLCEIKDLTPMTMALRLVKSPEEIEATKESVRICAQAFEHTMKNTRPGMMEYENAANFEYVVRKNGGKVAFESIVASGKNGTVLHYVTNNNVMQDGEMVLMDMGSNVGHYIADVTRTIPVNGVFDERQKEIYNIVLAGNEYIISVAKPGLTTTQLNKMLIGFYAEKLTEAGLIEEKTEVGEYYYHGVSHSIGLNVHDIHNKDIPLMPGMIISVEPGLYIEKYSLGIRIEDDVLITEDGCEVLTHMIPKTVEDIEELMANKEIE
ncbi:MAG: aminopeptidase P N-terminal domain-containing protein [Eubacteriaceae bacterium]|nr:aminopeptidase P N-terminal domain-containing protein [Eubacteriaceae bacterium]